MRHWQRVATMIGLALAGCSKSEEAPKVELPGLERMQKAAEARNVPTDPAKFQPYDSPDGLFRIRFPGKPEARKVEAMPGMGTTGTDVYSDEMFPPKYIVKVVRYAEKRDAAKEIESYIKANLRAGIDAKLLDSKDVEMKGRTGKEAYLLMTEDATRRTLILVGEQEVVQVVCDLPKTEADETNGKTFVGSFELLK